MKFRFIIVLFFTAAILFAQNKKSLTEYVNPFIGTDEGIDIFGK